MGFETVNTNAAQSKPAVFFRWQRANCQVGPARQRAYSQPEPRGRAQLRSIEIGPVWFF